MNKSNKHAADEFIAEESVLECIDINEGNAQDNITPASKDTTTARFIKFINVLLDVMDDENLKASFLVMDNCTIHQSKLMIGED
jgi:hypothetical protein